VISSVPWYSSNSDSISDTASKESVFRVEIILQHERGVVAREAESAHIMRHSPPAVLTTHRLRIAIKLPPATPAQHASCDASCLRPQPPPFNSDVQIQFPRLSDTTSHNPSDADPLILPVLLLDGSIQYPTITTDTTLARDLIRTLTQLDDVKRTVALE
jgi:hypothetical protein